MINYWLDGWRNFATFSGRARRSEFWYFGLMNLIVVILGSSIFGMISWKLGLVFYVLYLLAMIIPSLAVAVRRMHDTDHSGWFLLIPLYNLILECTEGTRGSNRYGNDPKGGDGLNNPDILDA